MTQSMTQTSESMNGMDDMALFTKGYGMLQFDVPDAVVYEHYIHGQLKGRYDNLGGRILAKMLTPLYHM